MISTTTAPHCAELESADITILNAARTILKNLASSGDDTRDGGVVYERATQAEYAIFEALSAYRIRGERELSDDDVHNRQAS